MKVQIVSIQAALTGRESIVWTGDVEHSKLVMFMPQEFRAQAVTSGAGSVPVVIVNAAIFRIFTRVDERDIKRLERIGYELPSLSVGDLIHWNETTWRVAGAGFEKITGSEEYTTALALYALKSVES